MKDILEIIDASVGKQIRKSAYVLLEDENLFDLGLTSIGFISLIVELEEHFGIVFEEDELDLDRFNTIGAIKSELDRKLETKHLETSFSDTKER